MRDVVGCAVVGAGPAGLGAAAMLRRRGVDVLVVERADAVAWTWRTRYDGFRLNTSSWFSYLPGLRYPREAGRWPDREAIVSYYERYALRNRLAFRFDTTVERLARSGSRWVLETADEPLAASHVVVATGKYHTPVIPDWPGRERFGAEVLHAAQYRNARPFREREVLVVGPGNSGFEIALQLAGEGAAKVWLAIRTPPHIVHRDVGPLPSDALAVLARRLPVGLVDAVAAGMRRLTMGDLSQCGLVAPPDGIYSRVRRTGMIPTVDGPFIEAVRAGDVEVVAAVERFEESAVVLADGVRLEPDVVIAATGYRRDLEPLVGHLGVLDGDGRPAVHGPETHPNAPHVRFIGFTEPFSGNLRELRFDSRKIARAVARDLGTRRRRQPSAKPAGRT
jgi:putative flavoprotein involved in K+ transport